jgi:hypothetical protein
MMQAGGRHFLAGARFSLDQHGGVRRCDPPQQVGDLVHALAHADHADYLLAGRVRWLPVGVRSEFGFENHHGVGWT